MLVDAGDAEWFARVPLRACSLILNSAGDWAAGHAWVSQNYTSEAMALKYRQMYEEVLGLPALATVPARRWTIRTLMRGARESARTSIAAKRPLRNLCPRPR